VGTFLIQRSQKPQSEHEIREKSEYSKDLEVEYPFIDSVRTTLIFIHTAERSDSPRILKMNY
jgi:hypothetical protein